MVWCRKSVLWFGELTDLIIFLGDLNSVLEFGVDDLDSCSELNLLLLIINERDLN